MNLEMQSNQAHTCQADRVGTTVTARMSDAVAPFRLPGTASSSY